MSRHQHKNTIQALSWSPNGNLVASASRDQTVRVFDIRAMKEFRVLKGHKKEVCCTINHSLYSLHNFLNSARFSPLYIAVAWHPVHPLLVSGGSEGAILHWDLSTPDSTTFTQSVSAPRATLSQAHDSNVWSLAYHPFGHILVSASNDHTTRFWSRERPGDASSVFSGGGEKPPEIIDTSGQDEDEDAMVPGFGGGAWWGKDEDGGGPNEGGGHLGEYPDDDFIPGFASSDAANRPNGQMLPPAHHQQHQQQQQQQQESMYGGGEERRMDEFGRDRDIGSSRSAVTGSNNNNDDWGRGGAHRSARFGPRRGGRY